ARRPPLQHQALGLRPRMRTKRLRQLNHNHKSFFAQRWCWCQGRRSIDIGQFLLGRVSAISVPDPQVAWRWRYGRRWGQGRLGRQDLQPKAQAQGSRGCVERGGGRGKHKG
ncbi:unnamed protein product, partial [Ectocarpus sp. 12 AP-2014]